MSSDATILAQIFMVLEQLDRQSPGMADDALAHAMGQVGRQCSDLCWERGGHSTRVNELARRVSKATMLNPLLCQDIAEQVLLPSCVKLVLKELREYAAGEHVSLPVACNQPNDIVADWIVE